MNEKKVRQSNMELLRILAMFMVLLFHCVFLPDGYPAHADVVAHPWSNFCDILLYVCSAVCVNVFVLLSGWFGIRPTRKSFAALAFMVIFYFVIGNMVGMLNGTIPMNGHTMVNLLTLSTEYWFVYAYVGLYIFAPVLNSYIEHTSRNHLKKTLICFYLLQTWYGWFRPQEAPFFMGGFSTISFVGLYMLARYLRLYAVGFSQQSGHLFLWYGWLSLAGAAFALGGLYLNVNTEYILWAFKYISPLIIFTAVLLLRGFVNLSLGHIPWINRLGASAFAVYLIHTHNGLFVYLKTAVGYLYGLNWAYPYYILGLLLMLVIVYLLCSLFDQIRLACWRAINRMLKD